MTLALKQLQLTTTAQRGCVCGLLLLIAGIAVGQEPAPKANAPKKSEQRIEQKAAAKAVAKPQTPVVVDEKAALQFASTHHPELAEILQTLRKSNKQQFQAAISDLSREQERLSRLAERDSERAKIAISAWQVDSRIRLEVARYTMAQDAEREVRIKELLRERADLRRQLLEFDYRRTQQRLAKMEEQLALQKQNADKQLSAEWERLKKSVAGPSKPKPARAPEAAKKKE